MVIVCAVSDGYYLPALLALLYVSRWLPPPHLRPSFSLLFTVYLTCSRCLCLFPVLCPNRLSPLHFSLLLYNISLTPSFPTTFNFSAQPSGIYLSLIFCLLYGCRRTKWTHIMSQEPTFYELLRSKYSFGSVCIHKWLQQIYHLSKIAAPQMCPSHLPCCQVQLCNQSKQNLLVKTD